MLLNFIGLKFRGCKFNFFSFLPSTVDLPPEKNCLREKDREIISKLVEFFRNYNIYDRNIHFLSNVCKQQNTLFKI